MKVKELKSFLEKLPDDMPVGLMDLTTSNHDGVVYSFELSEKQLTVRDYFEDENGKPVGRVLLITFKNKLSKN